MGTKSSAVSETFLEGTFRHLIYSPKGDYEGLLIDCDGAPAQVVFERHDGGESGAWFKGLEAGQRLRMEAELQGPSPKGVGAHPVYAFLRLVAVDGRKPAKPRSAATGPAYRGRVVRLNHARHGAANGVVLDTGDFIHTKPDGMAMLKLKVGATVSADGDAQRLVDDSGWAVEAATVNGISLGRRSEAPMPLRSAGDSTQRHPGRR